MADLRAVVQHLGTRVLGESFDIDEWQPPADLVERINKPSAEIEAVRADFSAALTAIAERVAALESTPTVLPHATYEAIKRAVDARLAALPQPEAVAVPLEAAALADLAARVETIERTKPVDQDEIQKLKQLCLNAVEVSAATSELVASLGDHTDTLVRTLGTMQGLMQDADKRAASMALLIEQNEARHKALVLANQHITKQLEDMASVLDAAASLIGKAQRARAA